MSERPIIPDIAGRYSDLVAALAKKDLDVNFAIHELLEANGPATEQLLSLQQEVESIDLPERFQHLEGNRLDIAAWILASAIYEMRIHALFSNQQPTLPYSHPNLMGIELFDGSLVDPSAFQSCKGGPMRGSTVFGICPSLPARNSLYWTFTALESIRHTATIRFRLDPYVEEDPESYSPMAFRMVMFGRDLDWDRIASLREPEFGRWADDSNLDRLTEWVWDPRGDEVHFSCEEVGRDSAGSLRTGRYLHSIFHKSSGAFIHVDGAIRAYDPDAFKSRRSLHLKDTGKLGYRAKLFRADGKIPKKQWADIVASYFVWNEDVAEYFGIQTLRSMSRNLRMKLE